MRTIEVRPCRNGWKVFEAPGVEPFYVGPNAKEQAISYANGRLKFSGSEVRVFDVAGAAKDLVSASAKAGLGREVKNRRC